MREYSGELGFEIGAHSLRATAATNALDHHAFSPTSDAEWVMDANSPSVATGFCSNVPKTPNTGPSVPAIDVIGL